MADVDASDGRGGAQIGAGFAGCGGEGLGDGAHATDDVAEEPLHLVVSAGEEVEQKAERGAGLRGAAVFSVEAVGEEKGADLLVFEVALKKVTEAAGEEFDEAGDLRAGDLAETGAEPESVHLAAQAANGKIGRRLEEEGLKIPSQALELVVHARELAGVAARKLIDLAEGAIAIGPPGERGAVWKWDEQGGIAGNHLETERGETEFVNDFGAKHAGDVGGGGGAAIGGDFLGYAAAAENFAAFEKSDGETGASEVGGGGEAVVAAADDDGVARQG